MKSIHATRRVWLIPHWWMEQLLQFGKTCFGRQNDRKQIVPLVDLSTSRHPWKLHLQNHQVHVLLRAEQFVESVAPGRWSISALGFHSEFPLDNLTACKIPPAWQHRDDLDFYGALESMIVFLFQASKRQDRAFHVLSQLHAYGHLAEPVDFQGYPVLPWLTHDKHAWEEIHHSFRELHESKVLTQSVIGSLAVQCQQALRKLWREQTRSDSLGLARPSAARLSVTVCSMVPIHLPLQWFLISCVCIPFDVMVRQRLEVLCWVQHTDLFPYRVPHAEHREEDTCVWLDLSILHVRLPWCQPLEQPCRLLASRFARKGSGNVRRFAVDWVSDPGDVSWLDAGLHLRWQVWHVVWIPHATWLWQVSLQTSGDNVEWTSTWAWIFLAILWSLQHVDVYDLDDKTFHGSHDTCPPRLTALANVSWWKHGILKIPNPA